MIKKLALMVCGLAACSRGTTFDPFGDASVPDMENTVADGGSARDFGPPVGVTVTVDRGIVVGNVPGAFAGLSYEKSQLAAGTTFSSLNTSLVSLFRLLGPSVLRIGGNSVDTTHWQAGAGAPDAGAATALVPANVDALAEFAVAANWQVLYGLNMKSSTPEAAQAEATYVANKLGAHLYGFEIGNEVDDYTSTSAETSWSYPIFLTQWPQFAAAVAAGAPTAALTGPAAASHYATWTVPFAHDEASSIVLLTQHYYRDNGQLATSTLAELLAPDPYLTAMLSALKTAAVDNHIGNGYRLAEANSFYHGGRDGVSDGYGAALWVIDFLFENAQYGSSGVNLHGGGNSAGYTPIADSHGTVDGVRPDYYGLLAFTRVGTGSLVMTQVDTQLNVSAYAVADINGSTNIVINNKESDTPLHATVNLSQAITAAQVTYLAGPSLDATSGYTLGGAAVEINGTWSPAAPEPLTVNTNTVDLDIPPANAAIVFLQ